MTQTRGARRLALTGVAVAATLAVLSPAWAVDIDGTWKQNVDGLWGVATNWVSDNIANGDNKTADFSTLNISANRIVTLDSARSIGTLKFADTGTDGSNTRGWTITNGGTAANKLTLSTGGAGTPQIYFGAKSSNAGNTVTFDLVLDGTEGVTLNPLAGYAYARPVIFSGDNTYTGTTTVSTGAFLQLQHDHALGGSSALIQNGGEIRIVTPNNVTRTISNNITIQGGGTLSGAGGGWTSLVLFTGGSISVSGEVHFNPHLYDTFKIDEVISETSTANISFDGEVSGNRGAIRLTKANAYSGTSTLTAASKVYVDHSNALGTAANSIMVNGTSASNGYAFLQITSTAGGLNANKTLTIGQYGEMTQGEGFTLSNTVYLNGGTYSFADDLAGNSHPNTTHNGSIVLGAGTESTFYRKGAAGVRWYQTGQISGDGGILIRGTDNNDNELHFQGNNTYHGGTRIIQGGLEQQTLVGSNTAFGDGPVVLQGVIGDSDGNDTMFTLDNNVSMSNAFSGVGRIATGANTFTLASGGSMAPGSSIGQLRVDNLDFKGIYYFEYDLDGGDTNPTDSDLISTANLTFSSGTATLVVQWTGGGAAGQGTYVLFTYTGNDPTNPNWTIYTTEADGLHGVVTVDTDTKQVLLTLSEVPEPATISLLLLGAAGLAGGLKRSRRIAR
ncbi:MAG: hypothetical protein BIFFINMI_02544 [Phycisphaerae bacterium]|nr:hypothetical protein [Phycisphaerae bacterium]